MLQQNTATDSLYPFVGNPRLDMPEGLAFCLKDYLALVDWTGRIIRADKRGALDASAPPILDRLKMEQKHWLYLTQQFESTFKGMVGRVFKLKQVCKKLGYQRIPSLTSCKNYFP